MGLITASQYTTDRYDDTRQDYYSDLTPGQIANRHSRDTELDAAYEAQADNPSRTPDWARTAIKRHEYDMRKLRALVLTAMRTCVPACTHATTAASRGANRQRGAQTRSTAKSGDGNGDDGGDPDPADRIIHDPWSFINTHEKSEPINRILRKAILAHRAGLQDTNPRVYNWYTSRALGEIRRAMHGLVTQWDGAYSYAHSLVSACAVRLFYHSCQPPKPKGAPKHASGGHDFDQRPNPVATDLVTSIAFRNVDDMRDYSRTGMFQDDRYADRKPWEGKAYDDVLDARVVLPTTAWNPDRDEAIEPSCEVFQGVEVKHLPAGLTVDNPKAKGKHTWSVKPVARVVSHRVTAAARTKDEDEEEDQYLVFAAYLHYQTFREDSNLDPLEAREAQEVTQAGTRARRIVRYVLRQPDREAAILEVAELLCQSGDDLVLEALARDRANAGVVADILGLVGYSYTPVPDPAAKAKVALDDDLCALARLGDGLLARMRDDIIKRLRERCGYDNATSNLLSALKTRAENKFGKFSAEIQRVARLLIGGAA